MFKWFWTIFSLGAPDKYKRKAKWRAYIAEFPIIPLQKKIRIPRKTNGKINKIKEILF